jgi:PAS domain S-box-containing protein
LASDPALAQPECFYWVRKLQALFFAADYVSALDASLKAEPLLWTAPSNLEIADYHLYGGLCRAASWDSAFPDQRKQHFEALTAHHRQLEVWAENCPENFENRAALVGAEIARLEGRDLDAMHLYEKAIHSAHTSGFVHNEALANELAARFYMARGFDKIAHTYLQAARDCYLQWGADGKVRQLEQLHPYLREEKPLPGPTSTIEAPVEHLDLATVIKVSQAVSSEVILERLIDKLMRVAMEHAGAERGLLILSRGTEPRIVAKATIDGDKVVVDLCDHPATAAVLPEAILHHVLRARESIILDDAAAQNPFSADSYIHQREARSILCLPLIAQAKLVGALYLENNLSARVFVSARIAVLKLLASQAAIALENARLYRDLAEREAKIRRLVDANIIGIFIWDLQGRIIEANDTFLRMVGYDHEDLAAGRVRWTDLTPPQWLDSTAGGLEEIDATGAAQAYEKEYLRKDGSRVPVLIGSAAFDEARDEGVTFVLDLTERKRAEAAAREVQLELAHANRVATMGQLSASIAHEINQPIGAAITYAQAGLSWLRAKPPNLEEALQALDSIVESSVRAGEVIDRIRALFKKAPIRNERLDINDGIREVIELTRGEVVKNDVSVQTDLADSLPLIHGDRVQLQQVVLNLIINAVEAMSGAGDGKRELLISTRGVAPQGVLVRVRDSGPGLAPATLEHIFDAFYTTKPNGLGIGLPICRSIIEAHGGKLWANANVPHGAIFQFTVPAYPDITS